MLDAGAPLRVALVNAFALPEFVSGATVQTHRLARELVGRGHEVELFAGSRDGGRGHAAPRRQLYDGIEVVTVNTDDHLTFEDPRSYDNPSAGEALLGWVEAFDPDIIHVHSLQGLGAGWIAAAAARAPVVVTMHDWWWLCSGQFLVTERLAVDGPLIDCADCPCWGGAAYTRRRRDWLRQQLAHAAIILTPSESMRDSLLSNGFEPGAVRADPNGLDALTAPRSRPRALPRLGFVGGAHELKGLPLLLDAVRRLPSPPPLELVCWGGEDSPDTRHLPAGVELRPSFRPEDAADVMASIDALAVPSLMRESFSLVTREALSVGTAVICSDCLGPEEVVRHGENGLVVESGSVAAWTEALRRWAEDAGLRDRLAAGAAIGTDLVTPGGQAAHVEEIYRQVLDNSLPAGAPGDATSPAPLLVLTGIEGAPLRYRVHHLAAAHRDLGGEVTILDHRDPGALDLVRPASLVILYRVPWSSLAAEVVARAREVGARTAFSVDDLIFDPSLRDSLPALRSLSRTEAEQWMEGVSRYQQTALACDTFIGSTPELVRQATEQGCDAHLLPNCLGVDEALLAQAAFEDSRDDRALRQAQGRCVIGYLSGTTTHDADWAVAAPAVAAVMTRHPHVDLVLAGHLAAVPELPEGRLRRLPFRPYQELYRLQANLDIVLAPLEPGIAFSEAKSAVKWLEAAAVGVATVASPTEPFRTVIEDGDTGLLATAEVWEQQLDRLVMDGELRRRIGLKARHAAYRDHGPANMRRAWAMLLPRLFAAPSRATPLPAGVLERATAAALEPSTPGVYADGVPGPPEEAGARLGGDLTVTRALKPLYPGLCRLDLHTTSFGDTRPLMMRLNANGQTLRHGTSAPAAEGWTAWDFEPIPDSAGRELLLEVSQPEASPGKGAALWSSLGEPDPRLRLCLRAWARPGREAVAALAMNRPISADRPGAPRRGVRVLLNKGRHSITARGSMETARRTARYARRWMRGRLRG